MFESFNYSAYKSVIAPHSKTLLLNLQSHRLILSYTTDTTGNRKLQYIQGKNRLTDTGEQKELRFNNANFHVM